MAHQCLKCGSLFADGTTTILRGCPECRGTRFFYTQEPLTLTERERVLDQSTRDLPRLAQEVGRAVPSDPVAIPQVTEAQAHTIGDGNVMVRLPKAMEQRIAKATQGWDYEAPTPAKATPAAPPLTPPAPQPSPVPPIRDDSRLPEWTGADQAPETVRIQGQGQYEIDVRRLLEKSPIVIHRDGTYVLHLPSLFEAGKSVKEPER